MTVEENGASFIIPTEMEAIRYNNTIKDFSLVTMPVPTPKPHEVVIKGTSAPNAQPSATINPPSPGSKVFTDAQTNPVKSCGICGTDLHIHNGDFASKTPVVTGHETSGIVVKIGEAVKDFKLGDKVTADNSEHLPRRKAIPFSNLSWTEAALFESATYAVHGTDRIRPETGSTVPLVGAGPPGLCLTQLLKYNGGAHLVIAARAGPKMQLAKKLHVADDYVDLDCTDSSGRWADLKASYPYGFDVVVEVLRSHQVFVLEKAIDYCSRGGKLVYYTYTRRMHSSKFHRSKVFSDEITMIG